jgi:hypothetical protein
MTTTEKIMLTFGVINATIFLASGTIAWLVYRWNDRQKKIDRAIELFKSLMTNEFLVKARLVSHEYLLEDPQNETYKKFQGQNFEVLDRNLRLDGNAKEVKDRFYIRAVPNFFGAVNDAWNAKYLAKDEKIFARIYAWYWVNIIKERQVPGNPMFSYHEWMTTHEHIKRAEEERATRLQSQRNAKT